MKSRPRLRAVLAAGAVCALAVTGISACFPGPARTFGAAPNAVTGTKPPPLDVLTRDTGGASGDIFIAPAGGGYPAGPEILTTAGKVVWFHRLPAGDVATDFRTQTYLGQPGPHLVPVRRPGRPMAAQAARRARSAQSGPSGTDYIYNDHYRQIATVRAGNGDATNFHEFLITPWNTALILADTVTTANLTSIGGPADQRVIDGLVQEIDIKTGRVLFQWDSAAHVPYADSYAPLPSSPSTPWDWFHINAVHLDTDGNLLVRLPEYLDHVQGEPAHWPDHVAARRQAQFLHPARRARPASSTATGRSSPGSTTRRPSAAASTRSSTTSRAATCSAPAGW